MNRDVIHYIVPPGREGFQGTRANLEATSISPLPDHPGLYCHWDDTLWSGRFRDQIWSGAALGCELRAGATPVGRAEATVFRFPAGTSGGQMRAAFEAVNASLAALGAVLERKPSWARLARSTRILYLEEIEIVAGRRGTGLGTAFSREILHHAQICFGAGRVMLLAWPFNHNATPGACAAQIPRGAVLVSDREAVEAHRRLHRFYQHILGVRPVRADGGHYWFSSPLGAMHPARAAA
ncbi:MAG: hypothetical protein PHE83_17565 [Opitutaceae bacterium]|nr:hypothetical protein [Opitutaceae bacterium]